MNEDSMDIDEARERLRERLFRAEVRELAARDQRDAARKAFEQADGQFVAALNAVARELEERGG